MTEGEAIQWLLDRIAEAKGEAPLTPVDDEATVEA